MHESISAPILQMSMCFSLVFGFCFLISRQIRQWSVVQSGSFTRDCHDSLRLSFFFVTDGWSWDMLCMCYARNWRYELSLVRLKGDSSTSITVSINFIVSNPAIRGTVSNDIISAFVLLCDTIVCSLHDLEFDTNTWVSKFTEHPIWCKLWICQIHSKICFLDEFVFFYIMMFWLISDSSREEKLENYTSLIALML